MTRLDHLAQQRQRGSAICGRGSTVAAARGIVSRATEPRSTKERDDEQERKARRDRAA